MGENGNNAKDEDVLSTDRRYYDVFLSYPHALEAEAETLAQQIESAGYSVFRDLSFTDFKDISKLDIDRIERLRDMLSMSTALIYCHSRKHATTEKPSVWTPWELGFFDGAMSQRLGVYLLDGSPRSFDPASYFEGCEYLQLYTPIAPEHPSKDGTIRARDARLWTLNNFLATFATRSRRIDNVRPAFQWMQTLQQESLANPVNVMLGIWEWNLHHAAKTAEGSPAAELLDRMKAEVGEMRQSRVEAFRNPFVDLMLDAFAKLQADARNAGAEGAGRADTAPGGVFAPHMPPDPADISARLSRLIAETPALRHLAEMGSPGGLSKDLSELSSPFDPKAMQAMVEAATAGWTEMIQSNPAFLSLLDMVNPAAAISVASPPKKRGQDQS